MLSCELDDIAENLKAYQHEQEAKAAQRAAGARAGRTVVRPC